MLGFKKINELDLKDCYTFLEEQEGHPNYEEVKALYESIVEGLKKQEDADFNACKTIEDYKNHIKKYEALAPAYKARHIDQANKEIDVFIKKEQEEEERRRIIAKQYEDKRKKRIKKAILISIATLIVAAIVAFFVGYEPVKYLNVSNNNVILENDGGSKTIVLETNVSENEIQFDLPDEDWIDVKCEYDKQGYKGELAIKMVSECNKNPERCCSLKVTAYPTLYGNRILWLHKTKTINITQKNGLATKLSVSPSSISFTYKGGTKDIDINTDGYWEISNINKLPQGITTKKEGNKLRLEVDPNYDWDRGFSLKISAGGKSCTINITQPAEFLLLDGKAYGKTYANDISLSKNGGVIMFNVKTNASSYDISGLPNWCRIKKKDNNGFTLEYDSNNTTSENVSLITIKAENKQIRFYIKQVGVPVTLSINGKTSDINKKFSENGGKEVYKVSTNAPYYEILNIPSWCSIENKTGSQFTLVCSKNSRMSSNNGYLEIKAGDKKIRINISQSPIPTNLTVNGYSSDFTIQISEIGGKKAFNVSTNASYYEISEIPDWCSIDKKSSTQFILLFKRNTNTTTKNGNIKVKAGGKEIKIKVTQSGNQENDLSKRTWKKNMRRALDYVNQNLDNGGYKGELYQNPYTRNTTRYGLGVYMWHTGSYYWGGWINDNRNGTGMYICSEGYTITNCPDCAIFVGDWNNDEKKGNGTCYDRFGNLIYYGSFSYNSPDDTPLQDLEEYSHYKFKCINYQGGDIYIGETKNGLRHGMGVYIWKNGDAWYGSWEEDCRKGYGIFLDYNGGHSTGEWECDRKIR